MVVRLAPLRGEGRGFGAKGGGGRSFEGRSFNKGAGEGRSFGSGRSGEGRSFGGKGGEGRGFAGKGEGRSFGGEGRRFMKLRHILGILRDSYCRTTGIEYMHIMDPEQRRWIQELGEQPREADLVAGHRQDRADAEA